MATRPSDTWHRLIVATAALLVAVSALGGAAVAASEPTSPAATSAPPQPVVPPYEAGLLRLSEILGSLHYLRQLCNDAEGNLWRDQMQGLIDAEQPDSVRRAQFIDRFNRGYDSFKSVYRSCTPAATLAIDRYMSEGSRIARDIVARYGRQE